MIGQVMLGGIHHIPLVCVHVCGCRWRIDCAMKTVSKVSSFKSSLMPYYF